MFQSVQLFAIGQLNGELARQQFLDRLPALHIAYELFSAAVHGRSLGRITPGTALHDDPRWRALSLAGLDPRPIRERLLVIWEERSRFLPELRPGDISATVAAGAVISEPTVRLVAQAQDK